MRIQLWTTPMHRMWCEDLARPGRAVPTFDGEGSLRQSERDSWAPGRIRWVGITRRRVDHYIDHMHDYLDRVNANPRPWWWEQ